MSQSIVLNAVTYTIPDVGDDNWGQNLTDYFVAIPSGVLQKSGGSFTLTADINFGATFGLVSAYYKSRTANIADAGVIRLAKTDLIEWRDNANSSNLELGINASDQLTFNGNPIIPSGGLTASRAVVTDGTGTLSVSTTTATQIGYLAIAAGTSGTGNIVYSAAPTFSGITTFPGTTTIDASGFIGIGKVPATILDMQGVAPLVRVTSSPGTGSAFFRAANTAGDVSIGLDNSTGSIFGVGNNAAVVFSSVASSLVFGTNNAVVGKFSSAGVMTISNLGMGIVHADSAGALTSSTIVNADVNASAAIAYSKLSLSNSIVNADINSSAAIAYSKLTLTGAILNADLAGSIAASKLVGTDIATVGTVTAGTWNATTIALNHGGTGQTTKAPAFDALSPMTTGGDLIYGGASGTGTRLANGSAGQVLTSGGTTVAPTWATPTTGTVTSVAASVPAFLSISGSPITTSGTLAISLSGTALPVANGGTGTTTSTGTGSTVLSASPTFTGTLNAAAIAATGNLSTTAGKLSVGVSSPGSARNEIHISGNANVLWVNNDFNDVSTEATHALLVGKGTTLTTTSQKFVGFYVNNGATACGEITANGANTAAFGVTSDLRLKENVENLPSQLAHILGLRPVEFDYKGYVPGTGHQVGFIAQEMREIYPDAVYTNADTEMMGIAGWDKTSARLVKAIQELAAQNAVLMARIESLERASNTH